MATSRRRKEENQTTVKKSDYTRQWTLIFLIHVNNQLINQSINQKILLKISYPIHYLICREKSEKKKDKIFSDLSWSIQTKVKIISFLMFLA